MSENKTPLMILKERVEYAINQCTETYNATDAEKFPSISMTTDAMRHTYSVILKEIEDLLPKEREVIENFGDKCQIISDVDIDGNVKFAFEPKELFKTNFEQ